MSMENLRQHGNSSDRIDQVPASTPEEIALGREIVGQELGNDFWLTTGLPRHVGTKGDDRVYGESVLVESDSPVAARTAYLDTEHIARVSTRLTNIMPAVVKVLFDPLGRGIRDAE